MEISGLMLDNDSISLILFQLSSPLDLYVEIKINKEGDKDMESDEVHYSSNKSGNYKFWILIGFILILLAVTNPSKDDFVKWVVNSSVEESDNEWVSAGINLFGSSVVSGVTTQQDLIFVSIFKMELGTETTSTLGFGKRFFIRLP